MGWVIGSALGLVFFVILAQVAVYGYRKIRFGE
jgi:hypothetical protein